MEKILPKDGRDASVGRQAIQESVVRFDFEFWQFRQITGADVGVDMEFELVEEDTFKNDKLVAQIKGRTVLNYMENGNISFAFDVKTINYAINSPYSFLLLLYEVTTDKLFFLCIQDYIKNDIGIQERLRKNSSSLSIHINPEDIVSKNNNKELIKLAKKRHRH